MFQELSFFIFYPHTVVLWTFKLSNIKRFVNTIFVDIFFITLLLSFKELVKIDAVQIKILICRSWEVNFRGPFYNDVIYRDDSYLWSNEELKIKAKDSKLTQNWPKLNGFTFTDSMGAKKQHEKVGRLKPPDKFRAISVF